MERGASILSLFMWSVDKALTINFPTCGAICFHEEKMRNYLSSKVKKIMRMRSL